MKKTNPNVDFDYDKYGNKVRKFVKGIDGQWREIEDFSPERGVDFKRIDSNLSERIVYTIK